MECPGYSRNTLECFFVPGAGCTGMMKKLRSPPGEVDIECTGGTVKDVRARLGPGTFHEEGQLELRQNTCKSHFSLSVKVCDAPSPID